MPKTAKAFLDNGERFLSFDNGALHEANEANMSLARQVVPSLRPVPLGLQPSFGFGDRMGLATGGHVASLLRSGTSIRPIFAQQSIREMTRTKRTPQQVMDEALFGVLLGSYRGPSGADADHLKTPADVDRTAAAGFCFFTIDPSDYVDGRTDSYNAGELNEKFAKVRDEVRWLGEYRGKSVKLPTGTVVQFSEEACLRAAVKYGRAVNHTIAMAAHIDKVMSKIGAYEIELSVDETPEPTTLAEHYIVAQQCLKADMRLVSLAPRYVGDFEKGVDYKGDVEEFQRSLADHAAIAAALGPYKLSLHSGSDKLSIYTIFARVTKGQFHVKTAGTSYLEALRVVARHEPEFFRELIDFSRCRYDEDKASYHVSATLAGVPAPAEIAEKAMLEKTYLGRWSDVGGGGGLCEPGRQILHCTFGSVLTHPGHSNRLGEVLKSHPQTYEVMLADHFHRHLAALKAGMK